MRCVPSLLAVLIGAAGCHSIYPFDRPSSVDAAGSGSDLARIDGSADAGPRDAAPDAAQPDLAAPDSAWPDAALPDSGPSWDQGGKVCTNLVVGGTAIQVSAASDVLSGGEPSIAAIGDTFYVAFVEAGGLYVRELDVTAATTTATPKVSAKLNTAAASAPWITRKGNASKLGLVWHEKTAASSCSSNARFTEVVSNTTTIVALPSCLLNTSYPYHGYGPPSLAYGSQWAFVSPVEYSGSACGTHTKIKYHGFSSCTAFSSGNDGAPVDTISTYFPVIAATGNSANAYLLIRLYDKDYSGSPTQLAVRVEISGSSVSSWSSLPSFPTTELAAVDRPALVVSDGGAWLAWTTLSNQIRLQRYDATSLKPAAPMAGYARHPALAHKPQVGTDPTSARAVLAFAETTASGAGTSAVRLATLGSAAPQVAGALVVAGSSSVSATVAFNPRQVVVAAGTNGFGVAWTEQVTANQSEVFFRWVGCQP